MYCEKHDRHYDSDFTECADCEELESRKLKQWELPNNTEVILEDGSVATFLKMDGMYAKWNHDGEFKTGNFAAILQGEDGKYYALYE